MYALVFCLENLGRPVIIFRLRGDEVRYRLGHIDTGSCAELASLVDNIGYLLSREGTADHDATSLQREDGRCGRR